MISCYDSYILRFKRGKGAGEATVEGDVEIVGAGSPARPFRNLEELWDILRSVERKSCFEKGL